MLQNQQTAILLDGKALAKLVREKLKEKIAAHLSAGRRAPGLAVILVGDDPASEIYVRNKVQACKQVGIESFFHKFDAEATEENIIACVENLNSDEAVDGILVQLPLPGGMSSDRVIASLSPDKDADGLHPFNLGLLLSGKPGLRPCTPLGIITMLEHHGVEMSGKNAVVIGRSNLVGKPVAALLLEKDATVTVCHSKTKNLGEIASAADILVVAMGKREFVPGSWVKPGACVIDVGIHYGEKKADGSASICGDVRFAEARSLAAMITPVPGGVGPMTVAMLLSNTVEAYERRMKGRQ